jgi:ribonuclease HII
MLLGKLHKVEFEAGCDEAGRGCLAGSVFAAAVILPDGYKHEGIMDSKKLSARKRDEMRRVIERDALAWAVGEVSAEEIDRINILNASILAMHRALDKLDIRPQAVIVDGNRFKPYGNIPYTTVVKGDGNYFSIAAASILAKTWRDEYMERIAAEYPQYHWDRNKGYPTAEQREAIRKYGITPYHRRSFTLLPVEEPQLPFDFSE